MFVPTSDYRPAPVYLHAASWGHDQWITHDYNGQELPLVYGSSEVNTKGSGSDKVSYAYHVSNGRHGAEVIAKDGQKANVYDVRQMVRKLCDKFIRTHSLNEPTYSNGVMTNDYNEAFATFGNGITIGCHMMRPESKGFNPDMGSVWLTIRTNGISMSFSTSHSRNFMKAANGLFRE